MKRRLFLQLLGITGIAAALPSSKTPLLTTEGLPPPKLDFPHYVIEGGSYTGQMFGGTLWSKGKNAAFAKDFDLLEYTPDGIPTTDNRQKEKPSTFFYSKKDLRGAPWIDIPGVDARTASALSAFREHMHEELQSLALKAQCEIHWNKKSNSDKGTGPISLVTCVRGPLQVKLSPKKENGIRDLVEVALHYENYVVIGEVKPQRLWSDCGRIPLQSDFASNAELHAWFDQKARENTFLDNTGWGPIRPGALRGNRIA